MLPAYGIKEATVVTAPAEAHAEEIRMCGYTIVRAVMDAPDVAHTRQRLDAVYTTQVRESAGEERLQAINEADVARCLLAYDPAFLPLVHEARVLAVVEMLLGPAFVLQLQNGVFNRPTPSMHQRAWHRDLPYQHFVSSRPLAISALWCIDAFNATTGGTCVLPGTHKAEAFPSDTFVQAHASVVEMSPGDVLVFDSMLFHRAGHNTSDAVRRAINHVYTLPFIQQQISLPKALGVQWASDARLAQLLGYKSCPPESVKAWRERRWGSL